MTNLARLPFNFDPLDYQFGNQKGEVTLSKPPITADGATSRIIRWSWNPDIDHAKPLTSGKAALAIIKRHRQHLAVLQDGGITIPEQSMFIAEHPRYIGCIAIYSMVEHIKNERLCLGANRETCHALGKALSHYSDWLDSSHQKHFLSDITEATQYAVGDDNQPILLDVEPAYTPVRYRGAEDMYRAALRQEAVMYQAL